MNDINVNQILVQIRAMEAQAKGLPEVGQAGSTSGADFSAMFVQSINAVNETQKASGSLKKRFDMGDQSVGMVDIAIASEKSKIAFTAMKEVRNKLVEAYKEIMSMPV